MRIPHQTDFESKGIVKWGCSPFYLHAERTPTKWIFIGPKYPLDLFFVFAYFQGQITHNIGMRGRTTKYAQS